MTTHCCLNLILSRSHLEINNIEYIAPVGVSDHSLLVFHMNDDGAILSVDLTRKKIFHNSDYDKANRKFKLCNWENEQRRLGRELEDFPAELQHCCVFLYPLMSSRKPTNEMEAQVDDLESWRKFREKKQPGRTISSRGSRIRTKHTVKRAASPP